ncbi:MAG TPA: nitroreductase/quinone reductase family protein [Rubrobacteraceae bacterium]|nr:nitroreductase/quinone reductase family protein [Rubrobacteraceae bacterium]
MRLQRLYNPFVVALLRSPLHGIMSGSTMLITYRGRRTGNEHTTPVNYVEDGDTLLVVSSRDHDWWKNLRGGAPVAVRVRGRDLSGVGEAFEGEAAIEEGGLLTVLRRVAAYRRYFRIEIGPGGEVTNPEVLAMVARANALVRVGRLSPARGGSRERTGGR